MYVPLDEGESPTSPKSNMAAFKWRAAGRKVAKTIATRNIAEKVKEMQRLKALKEVLQGTRVGSGSGSGGSGAAAEGDLDYFDDGSGSVEERRLGRYFRLESVLLINYQLTTN